jgi:cell wall-associated NlpC family hydrolase
MDNKSILTMFFTSSLNTPYKWGGDNPFNGFDCSGFVQEALSSIDLDPPCDQTSDALYRYFKDPLKGRQNTLQFGSLLFFGKEEKITHVAIALNGVSMIEAGGGGSKTKTIDDAIRDKAYVRIRPIRRRLDLVCAILPIRL